MSGSQQGLWKAHKHTEKTEGMPVEGRELKFIDRRLIIRLDTFESFSTYGIQSPLASIKLIKHMKQVYLLPYGGSGNSFKKPFASSPLWRQR